MSWKIWLCIILGAIGAPVVTEAILGDSDWCRHRASSGGRCGDGLSGGGYYSGGGFGNGN